MSTPALRFPEFSGAGQIKALRDISKLITKGTTPQSFAKEGVNFIKIESLEGKKINAEKCAFIDRTTHAKELKRSILFEGDLLFAIAGATIGKCSIVTADILPANTNQALAIVRLHDHESREYIYQIVNSHKMRRYILDNISVGAQPNLNLEQMGSFSFYYPKKSEQAKIADFLTAVDEKISLLTRKHDLLTQYKKGVMQQIFSQELRFKDDDGQDYPEWVETCIGKVLTIGSGKDYKHLSAGEIPVYGTGGYMLSVNKYLYDGESVCIGRKGTIDKPTLLSGKFWTVDTLFYTHSFKKCLPKFIYAYFQTIDWKNYNEASGVPSLSKSTIEKIEIKIPVVAEQTKIAAFLTAIDDKITTTRSKLTAAKQYKQGLLQQLFV